MKLMLTFVNQTLLPNTAKQHLAKTFLDRKQKRRVFSRITLTKENTFPIKQQKQTFIVIFPSMWETIKRIRTYI